MLTKSKKHTPLYVCLADIIKKRIREKKYLEGHSIPSEMELQKEFSISRTTVRKALRLLTDQNMLIKLPGKGTFVSDRGNEVKTQNQQFSSLTENVKKTGKSTTTRLISIRKIIGSENQNKFFQLQSDQQLVEIKRLRYINGVPFCVEWIWLPHEYEDVKEDNLDMPLYKLLENRYHVAPGNGKKTFKIAFATREESFLLNVDEQAPLMQINDYVYDKSGQPLHISQEILRSDKFTYAVNH